MGEQLQGEVAGGGHRGARWPKGIVGKEDSSDKSRSWARPPKTLIAT